MTDATRSTIIKAKPIANGLDAFRDSSQSLLHGLDASSLTAVLDRIGDERLQDYTIDLVLALQALPVSRSLPSSSGRKNLFSDLSRLNLAVNSGDLDVRRVIPLLAAVVNLYELLAESAATSDVKPSTPPPSDPSRTASFQQTPWTFNTGSFADTSDLRRNVDPLLRTEVEDDLRIDHPGVFATFFGKIQKLGEITLAVLESCKEADPPLFQEDVGWVEWPEGCEKASVLQFLCRHIDRFLLLADERGFRPSKHRRCITTPNKPIPGSVSKRKLDVDGQSYDWSHILIPGELKSNPREDKHSSTWLDLVRYAREIFSAQDTRRFILGFTLYGTIMRTWEFDRLGVVGSTLFDINKDAHMFVSVVMGFLWMSEEQLGFDPTIAEDGVRYTTIQQNDQIELIYAPDQALVIKDSWEYEERPEQGLLLKEATEAGVENVARYYYHETVHSGGTVDDVLENVQKGLSDITGWNPLQQRAAPFESIMNPTTSLTSGLGRGRSRSSTRTTGRKRSLSSIDASMPPPKRSCSDSPVKQVVQRRNRVHRRLIMRDVGKSLYEAGSLRGILTKLLGGIKADFVGHESLLDAKILHQDVSIVNVMLTMVEDDGFMIDLDLAIKIDRENASGAPSKTGTKVFMAISALYADKDHNFMHDLESFFGVLFWIGYGSWNYKDTRELAEVKAG
ncbi:hypothetical protein CC86DRAFT_447202 [Ophiobolus disseminans]|uniref:Fungal-type protein kinase domain-containing protein n=1 Tax=Ophiobolus disseminans TaxID=1469910 RepID=A0A6A6ZTD3_9PLEO|nr:hypothetical protein CC86DRAFT_447202 [Ophiobolus disseminans]